MAVYLHQQFPRRCRFGSERQYIWLRRLALPVVATLLVTLPLQCWAEAEATEKSKKPVTGAGIAKEYFPDEPSPEDLKASLPNIKNFDDNLDEITPSIHPIMIGKKYKVVLPAGKAEIIETINVTKLVDQNSEAFKNALKVPAAQFGNPNQPDYTVPLYELHIEVENANEGPMEVIIALIEGMTDEDAEANAESGYGYVTDKAIYSMWELGVDGVSYHTNKADNDDDLEYKNENIFRDVLWDGYMYRVNVTTVTGNKPIKTSAVLAVILRRPTSCLMRATYWGDLSGADFGDLAYYNNFLKEGSRFEKQGGVAIATGSGADDKALRLTEALIGGGQVYSKAEYQAMTGEEVDVFAVDPKDPETDYKANPPAPTKDLSYTMHAFEDFASGRGEVDKPELETFGLSMAGRKPNVRIDPGTAYLRTAGGAVMIEVASRAKMDEFFYQKSNKDKNEKPKENEPIYMVLSRVLMMTKDRFDDGTPARFTWKAGEDAGPAPKLQVHTGPGNLGFSGKLTGNLTAENYRLPSGQKAQIVVNAKFIAAEGAFGCDFGTFR